MKNSITLDQVARVAKKSAAGVRTDVHLLVLGVEPRVIGRIFGSEARIKYIKWRRQLKKRIKASKSKSYRSLRRMVSDEA